MNFLKSNEEANSCFLIFFNVLADPVRSALIPTMCYYYILAKIIYYKVVVFVGLVCDGTRSERREGGFQK